MISKCRQCGESFNVRTKINGVIHKYVGRIYCWDCVPPRGKFPTPSINYENSTKKCGKCQIHKPFSEFNKGKYKHHPYACYCKSCMTEQTLLRMYKFKIDCIKYKGGKCVRCGYDKCPAAFDFHHIDRTKKEFLISKYKSNKINDKVRAELDKCELLCSNCHREEHTKILDYQSQIEF